MIQVPISQVKRKKQANYVGHKLNSSEIPSISSDFCIHNCLSKFTWHSKNIISLENLEPVLKMKICFYCLFAYVVIVQQFIDNGQSNSNK